MKTYDALVTAWWSDGAKRLIHSNSEAIITLWNVAFLMGLWIDSRAVTAPPYHDWQATYSELLALTLDACSLDGVRLRLWWLQQHFGEALPPNATKIIVRQYARDICWPYV